MLRDAKAALKKEQKSKADADEAVKASKAELEDVLKEARTKEAELNTKVTEEGTIKERLDASLSSDRVQSEEAVSTLRTQLTEAKTALREAEGNATEFAKQYGKEFYLRKQIAEQLQEMTGGLRVFCRVRPTAEGEGEEEIAVKVLDETTILLEDPKNTRKPRSRFEFNQVYGPTAEQSKVFEDMRPMISQVLSGFNVCVIVYGATGSGKTFALEGGSTPESQGMILRAVNAVFDEITGQDEMTKNEVFLSTLEIVDETIRDLQLDKGAAQPVYKISRDPTYGMQVDGLSTANVHTASHVKSLINGAHKARTKEDEVHPSGSSMVVNLTVRSANTESGESSVGKLTLVDMIGAESLAMAEESCDPAIRAVGKVVDSLSAGKGKKPDYSASLLTELLQDSLGGNSKTMMFVTVAPTMSKAPESGAVLAFGEKARKIQLGAASKVKESMQTAFNKVNTTMSALTAASKK